jgi:WXG100 family type VII secretion target
MADQLRVDADTAFNTSHVVSNDAEELREELSRLSREWDNVSHGWSGVAASAFTQIWEEWHEGAANIVETLAESSRRLAKAAVLYEERDANSAQMLDSAGDGVGL